MVVTGVKAEVGGAVAGAGVGVGVGEGVGEGVGVSSSPVEGVGVVIMGVGASRPWRSGRGKTKCPSEVTRMGVEGVVVVEGG
ncbi:hypothetical protein E2C01_081622 [Portunus trituberculatus]|uniref:Uncharacterized protein n=1 Tax=Portunus trituberculatus TaxID=210409 RepID=A0A5B7IYM0_PORTR|nr:hypothetical protein [Portunus trituberculatus]